MRLFNVNTKTIQDLWFQLIYNIFDNSYKQQIQSGSFENEQYRLQYPGVSAYIERPWEDMIPVMPYGSNIPAPTSMEYVNDYFANYLMDPSLGENETYKYASRIQHPMPKGGTQLERVIDMLKKTPLTNQATIEIGSPEDLDVCWGKDGKCDPPCCRLISFKVIPQDGRLTLAVSVFFRSWDLWAGLPSNLAGIELLKQYVAQETGLENGPMYAYSDGLHIYGYQEEIARLRANKSNT